MEGIFRREGKGLRLTETGDIIGKQGRKLIVLSEGLREIERLGGEVGKMATATLARAKEVA